MVEKTIRILKYIRAASNLPVEFMKMNLPNPYKYKRHTILRPLEIHQKILKEMNEEIGKSKIKEIPLIEQFNNLLPEALFKIKQSLEHRMLIEYAKSLPTKIEVKELIDNYNFQKDIERKFYLNPEVKSQAYGQKETNKDEFFNSYVSIDGQGMNYVTPDDIGKYIIYPKEYFEKVFPSKMFGKFLEDDYSLSGVYAFMVREESLKITYELSRRALSKERKINLLNLKINQKELNKLIENEFIFTALFQEFSLDLLSLRNSKDVKDILQNADIFDGLITLIIRELPNLPFILDKDMRIEALKQILTQIINISKKFNIRPLLFNDVAYRIPYFEFKIQNLPREYFTEGETNHDFKIDLRFCLANELHHWRPQLMKNHFPKKFLGFNSGLLLTGPRGIGKSQILTYISMWAFENNWIILNIPQASAFTRIPGEITRHKNGLYVQEELATTLLKDFNKTNSEKFEEIQVNLQLYGKCDLTGHHDDDPEPCPVVYDPRRKTYSDDWKKFLLEDEILELNKKFETFNTRISKELKEPNTVKEIIMFGIAHPLYSTCALAEALIQLYNNDKFNFLICIDEYNEWFRESYYTSFRYANNKSHMNLIPPYHIAIPRLLMNFDGHLIKNGVKVCATSQYKMFNHICKPNMINFPEDYSIDVTPLTLNDFRNALNHFNLVGISKSYLDDCEVERYFAETQGNWTDFWMSYDRSNC